MVWYLFPPKVILVWEKARSLKVPNLGYRRVQSPGWFDVSQKYSAQDVIHEQTCCHDEAANQHLSIAAAFRIIWIVPMEECSSLTQNWMQIHCSTRSIILNVMATLYTCSLKGIYCPQWLVQWSPHCSCTDIPVHSPWLPGYIDVMQTILVILIMAGLFPDRPCMVCVCTVFIYLYIKENSNES